MASPLFHPSTAAISPVEIIVDGHSVMAAPGRMLAAALLVAGVGRVAPLCLMGSCYQCLVTVDGRPNQRACRIPVTAGLTIAT
jgi:predicted molibdopterin-dependent oxidoreductase YjgC